jgi:hypothetical protein
MNLSDSGEGYDSRTTVHLLVGWETVDLEEDPTGSDLLTAILPPVSSKVTGKCDVKPNHTENLVDC